MERKEKEMAETKTKRRVLVITAKDGSKWAIAGEVIAHNRALFYAKDDPDTTYKDEFEFTMTARHEMTDWAGNNMNFEDVKEFVRPYSPAPKVDLDAAWSDGFEEAEISAEIDLPVPEGIQ